MFEWISQLFNFLGSFFPRPVVVKATHGAVKFVRGSRVVAMDPGFHIYWPLITDYVEIATARQTINLETQVLLTEEEGKPLAVSGVVVYEITDVVAAIGRSYDVEDTISDIGLTSIVDVLSGKPLPELVQKQRTGQLAKELTEACAAQLEEFGVNVLKCALTDFSTCMVLKTLGSASTTVLPSEA